MVATPVLVILLLVYKLLHCMSYGKFMLPFVSILKSREVTAPMTVSVNAPNLQSKPAKPVHAPVMNSAEFTDAFVPFVPKFDVMLLSCVGASLVK